MNLSCTEREAPSSEVQAYLASTVLRFWSLLLLSSICLQVYAQQIVLSQREWTCTLTCRYQLPWRTLQGAASDAAAAGTVRPAGRPGCGQLPLPDLPEAAPGRAGLWPPPVAPRHDSCIPSFMFSPQMYCARDCRHSLYCAETVLTH